MRAQNQTSPGLARGRCIWRLSIQPVARPISGLVWKPGNTCVTGKGGLTSLSYLSDTTAAYDCKSEWRACWPASASAKEFRQRPSACTMSGYPMPYPSFAPVKPKQMTTREHLPRRRGPASCRSHVSIQTEGFTRSRTSAAFAAKSRDGFPGSGQPRRGFGRILRGLLEGPAARRAAGTGRKESCRRNRPGGGRRVGPRRRANPAISRGFAVGTGSAPAGAAAGRCSVRIGWPRATIAACSIALRNSRTLPVQGRLRSSSSTSPASGLGARQPRRACRKKCSARAGNVISALAQGRKVNLEDAEAEKQVFAKFAGRHQLAQRSVGRRDDADVGEPRAARRRLA